MNRGGKIEKPDKEFLACQVCFLPFNKYQNYPFIHTVCGNSVCLFCLINISKPKFCPFCKDGFRFLRQLIFEEIDDGTIDEPKISKEEFDTQVKYISTLANDPDHEDLIEEEEEEDEEDVAHRIEFQNMHHYLEYSYDTFFLSLEERFERDEMYHYAFDNLTITNPKLAFYSKFHEYLLSSFNGDFTVETFQVKVLRNYFDILASFILKNQIKEYENEYNKLQRAEQKNYDALKVENLRQKLIRNKQFLESYSKRAATILNFLNPSSTYWNEKKDIIEEIRDEIFDHFDLLRDFFVPLGETHARQLSEYIPQTLLFLKTQQILDGIDQFEREGYFYFNR